MAEHDCIYGHLGCSDREGGPCIDELLTMAEACEADADQAEKEGRHDVFMALSKRAIKLYNLVEKIDINKQEKTYD